MAPQTATTLRHPPPPLERGAPPLPTVRLPTVALLPTVFLARELSPQLVQAQVTSGAWTRVRRGAYVATASLLPDAAPQTRELARIAAVARQLSPAVTFTHESAALIWGLPLWRSPDRVHVHHPSLRSGHASQDVSRSSGVLDASDVVVRSGLRVTSLERTVVDCARSSSAVSGLVVADAALRRGVDPDSLRARLQDLGPARGVRIARAVIDLADGGAESPWESATRLVLVGAGLPRPSTQVRVVTRLGAFRTDLGWEDWKVAVEFDGLVKYTTLAAGDPGRVIFEEKRRHDAIVEAGWRVVRATREDVQPSNSLRERVQRLLPVGAQCPLRPAPHLLQGF